jgi:hypothetical protein
MALSRIINLGLYGSLKPRDFFATQTPPLPPRVKFAPFAAAGYAAGGLLGPPTFAIVSTVDKFLFSNDSRSTLGTGLSSTRRLLAGFASPTAGYAAGGYSPDTTTVNKFLFSDDSRSTLATGLSSARSRLGGFASATAGYAVGGTGTPLSTTTVDKFLFSDDSRSTLATGLSLARRYPAGFASETSGYAAGGLTPDTTTVDKFLFSNDSRSTLATGLSSARGAAAGFASPTAGYAAGGILGPPANTLVSTVDKFLFSDDSRSTLGTGLSSTRSRLGGFASLTAGYAAGGYNASTVDKFLFSNDSRSTLATGLSIARDQLAGFDNTKAFL